MTVAGENRYPHRYPVTDAVMRGVENLVMARLCGGIHHADYLIRNQFPPAWANNKTDEEVK